MTAPKGRKPGEALSRAPATIRAGQASDPNRFAAGVADVVPLGRVRVIDMLTEEQRQENAAHAEVMGRILLED